MSAMDQYYLELEEKHYNDQCNGQCPICKERQNPEENYYETI